MSRVPLILALATVITSMACRNDNTCERCDYTFDWTSDGQLTNTFSTCEEFDCDADLCGLCVDIEYNLLNLPVSGTCYSCPSNLVSQCPVGFEPCEEHFLYEGERCVDLQLDPLHCGDCRVACGENEECADGECVERPL